MRTSSGRLWCDCSDYRQSKVPIEVLWSCVSTIVALFNVFAVPLHVAFAPTQTITLAQYAINFCSDWIYICVWIPFTVLKRRKTAHPLLERHLSSRLNLSSKVAPSGVIPTGFSKKKMMGLHSSSSMNSQNSKWQPNAASFVTAAEAMAMFPFEILVIAVKGLDFAESLYPTWIMRLPRILLFVPLFQSYVARQLA